MLRTRSKSRLRAPYVIVFCLLANALPASLTVALAGEDQQLADRLFSSSDVLDITLTLPRQAIERDEFFFQGTYPAEIEFTDDFGKVNTLALTTERRGMARQVVCRFPPIKLRFQKDAVKGTLLHGQKSLKMVTHCDTTQRTSQYSVIEMLAYQMYNLITDYSFRVRPLSVTYQDSKSARSTGPRFAFLIEDDSDVAKRNGHKKYKGETVTLDQLDSQESSYMSLFEYMIGNTDWSTASEQDSEQCCKNVKLIGRDTVYAIPNDFDSSGLVDAHYAVTPTGLPITHVTQRLFRGFCAHNGTLGVAKQRFLTKEQGIFALIENEERLSSDSRQKVAKYLEGFFVVIRDQDKFEKEVVSGCRQ